MGCIALFLFIFTDFKNTLFRGYKETRRALVAALDDVQRLFRDNDSRQTSHEVFLVARCPA